MRKTIFTLCLLIFCGTMYSQNRYSNGSTSTYKPASTPNQAYYQAIAEERIENIKSNIIYYDNLVQNALNSNNDQILKESLWEINQYLNTLKETEGMSLDNAEWYLRTINKKYNKAIRKYNKRIKQKTKG